MASIDLTQFIDLRVYDKSPEDIYEAALQVLQTALPEWEPDPTDPAVLLLQALALEVAEAGYMIDRLPTAMAEIQAGLFGLTRNPGTPPTTTVTFTMSDDTGYTIPEGTQVAMSWPGRQFSYAFYTTGPLVIPPSSTSGTVAVAGTVPTGSLNGVLAGTSLELVDALSAVETVVTASSVTGGSNAESDSDFYTRAVARYSRLSEALVLPKHFPAYALESPLVSRATVINNYDPTAYMPDPGDHPGHVTVVVYGVGGLMTLEQRDTLEADMADRAVSGLSVHVISAELATQNIDVTVKKFATFEDADVEAEIEAALNAYFSPETWPWSGTVRRNEVIALISNCVSVDYVDTLTTPASDVVLSIDDTLVSLGTLTVTVI